MFPFLFWRISYLKHCCVSPLFFLINLISTKDLTCIFFLFSQWLLKNSNLSQYKLLEVMHISLLNLRHHDGSRFISLCSVADVVCNKHKLIYVLHLHCIY